MKTYLETVASSVNDLMKKNNLCIYIGEDVRNGQRTISENFITRYGKKRVIDTPISESAFCGLAVGLALNGFRPIVEFNFSGLVFVSIDQIFNQASKYKQMLGGKKEIPIIYLLPTGTKGGLAAHHSDNPYSLLAHLGIKCFMPTNKKNISKIIKHAYNLKEPVAVFLPVEEFRNTRDLKSKDKNKNFEKLLDSTSKKTFDLSIISSGTTISICYDAITKLDKKQSSRCSLYGINDLLIGKDTEKKIAKVKSKKILIVDDSPSGFGLSSQIELILRRNKKIVFNEISSITRNSNFIPFNKKLENKIRPTELKIRNKIVRMLNENN